MAFGRPGARAGATADIRSRGWGAGLGPMAMSEVSGRGVGAGQGGIAGCDRGRGHSGGSLAPGTLPAQES